MILSYSSTQQAGVSAITFPFVVATASELVVKLGGTPTSAFTLTSPNEITLGTPLAADTLVEIAQANEENALNPVQVVDMDGLSVLGSATATGVLFTVDTTGFTSIAVHVTSPGTSSTITYEQSNDGTTWLNAIGLNVTSSNASGSSASNSAVVMTFPALARYFRARVSTYGSGTVTALAYLRKTEASAHNSVYIAGSVGGSSSVSVIGAAAHSSATTLAPVGVAGRVMTANETNLVAGDVSDFKMTTNGAVINYPYSAPDLTWNYAAASGGITNSTDVTVKAAAGSGVRNFIRDLDVRNAHASVATEFVIKDGASTVLWRGHLPANGDQVSITFDPPLRGTANTAVNIACVTTGAQVYANVRGFTAP